MNFPDMPEIILRRIWQEQNFSTEHLSTSDGRAVRILSPGTPNTDGGPDFIGAKISIDKTVYRGDVELHINAEEWLAHKHDTDPHYNKVILHVVLTAEPLSPPARTASQRSIPLLVLHPFLDETFRHAWSKALLDEQTNKPHSLACVESNDNVPTKVILDWIEKLARERIELKVRRFEERLKQLVDETRHVVREPYPRYYGNPAEIPIPRREYTKKDFTDKSLWEQLLYEGIVEALGYAKNSQPFLALARSMRLNFLRKHPLDDAQTMMALLFGAAGLLPSSTAIQQKESRAYVAGLRGRWKQLRPTFKGEVLHEADWLFFRLRPSNFPTARLTAMCFILPKLFGNESFRKLIGIFKSEALTTKERINKLHELFSFEPDKFWQHHYHFKATSRKHSNRTEDEENSSSGKARTVLGTTRINDIIINTIIPVVLLYARQFNDNATRKSARLLFAQLSATQKNNVTEIVQQQLLKDKAPINSSLLQQGTIQLYRFYCSHVRCMECAIGRFLSLG